MKFSLQILALALTSFTPTLALPEPAVAIPEPTTYSSPVVGRTLEKRDNSAVVEVDGLRYRTCPRTSCAAIGQYPIGTHITLVCYTRDDTTVVDGDAGWAKATNGYWSALAFGTYISWSGELPYCT